MEFSEFQHCCGMREVGAFNLEGYTAIKTHISEQLEFWADAYEHDRENGDESSSPGALVATTVATQTEAIRALKFHKFRKVMVFTNPGSGNKVTLWAKKLVK
jgi:hypothetical protein